MPASRTSNRLIGSVTVASVIGFGLLWRFLVMPSGAEIERAKRNGVVSDEEAVPTSIQQQWNAKTAHKVELRKAIKRGDWQRIEALLAQGVGIDENLGDCTALMTAAQYGHVEIVNRLLTAGAKLEAHDLYGNTALLYAARYGQNAVIKTLIDHGADLQAKNRGELNAVDLAITGNHRQTYDYLKSQKLTVNPFQAMTMNDESHLRNIVAHGADVNATYISGNPLAYQEEKSGLYISQGTSTIFAVSSVMGKPSFPAYTYATPLLGALQLEQWDTAEYLVSRGAKVDQMDKGGWTALLHLASTANLHALKFLLEHGANINQSDKTGRTPLMLARSFNSKPQTIQFFLKHGANIDQQDKSGFTALMHAVNYSDVEGVKILLSHSARLDIKGTKGEDVFSLARSLQQETRTKIEHLLKEAQAKS